MIWTKTVTGRAEISARALVHERARRNLLLLIDGVRSQDSLLGSVAGIGPGDFDQLARLGLIVRGPADTVSTTRHATAGAAGAVRVSAPSPKSAALPVLDIPFYEKQQRPAPSYGPFTANLTQLISNELGLRGFRLTLAVEKAANVKELEPVAARVLAEITKRKGEAAAETARRRLYGA